MSVINQFISKYCYLKPQTWPTKAEFTLIINSFLDDSFISELETTPIHSSIAILIGLFHLIWNCNKEPNISKADSLITKCSALDYGPIVYYFEGKLKFFQNDSESALALYKKAKESLSLLKDNDPLQLTKLLIAMGSIEDASFADESFAIFSTVLSIDTALAHLSLGNAQGIHELKTAFETQQRIYKTDEHPNAAYTLRLLAEAYLTEHNRTDAESCINRVTAIADVCYPDNSHPEFIAISEFKERFEDASNQSYE